MQLLWSDKRNICYIERIRWGCNAHSPETLAQKNNYKIYCHISTLHNWKLLLKNFQGSEVTNLYSKSQQLTSLMYVLNCRVKPNLLPAGCTVIAWCVNIHHPSSFLMLFEFWPLMQHDLSKDFKFSNDWQKQVDHNFMTTQPLIIKLGSKTSGTSFRWTHPTLPLLWVIS